MDEYYTQEFPIGVETIHGVERELFWRWHQTEESYPRDHRELGVAFKKAGTRQYVHARVSYAVPNLVLQVAIPNVGVGKVVGTRTDGETLRTIYNAQGWYYGDLQTLMVWEVVGEASPQCEPVKDELLKRCWTDFERKLFAAFPDCKRILTPWADPQHDTDDYRDFLRSRGYHAGDAESGVYLKPVKLSKPSGWVHSGGKWYTKSSQYGQRYMCPHCGKKNLGIGGSNMHWPRCIR